MNKHFTKEEVPMIEIWKRSTLLIKKMQIKLK